MFGSTTLTKNEKKITNYTLMYNFIRDKKLV